MENRADNTMTSLPLIGRAGLDRLRPHGRFTVEDIGTYRSSWRCLTVDGIELNAWSTTAISGSAPTSSGPSVVLLAVTDGIVRYACTAQGHEATVGRVHVLQGATTARFAVPKQSTLLRVVIPAALLPHRLQKTLFPDVLPQTKLTTSLVSLVEAVLDPIGGALSPANRAISALVTATLEESAPELPTPGLHEEILKFIEDHLADPGLGPKIIAAEFGVSLRWVHHLFTSDEHTLAQHIRLRRLEFVAAQLESDRRFPRIGLLAQRSGFASRDTLTRSFKARYGISIAGYFARTHEPGVGPVAPPGPNPSQGPPDVET